MPEFLPAVPGDWAARAANGTPYVLGVEGGEAAWRSVIEFPAVTANDTHLVTAESGRPVFVG